MSYKTYEFGLNLSEIPNFDIHANTKTVDVSSEYLDRYSTYLKEIIPSLDKYNIVVLTIYTSRSFVDFSKIKTFIESLLGYVDWFVIDTYENNVLENWNIILELWNKLGGNFNVNLEWNLDSTDLFWYTFTKILGRNLSSKINAEMSGDTITKLPDLINTFITNSDISIDKDLGFGRLSLFLSLNETKYANFNKELAQIAIQESVDIIKNNIDLANEVISSNKITFYNKLTNTKYTNKIYLDWMTGDGVIYPSYQVPYMSTYGLENYKLGHISEDLAMLLDKRKMVKTNDQSVIENLDDYHKLFLSVPFIESDENKIDKVNVQPFPEACELYELLKESL